MAAYARVSTLGEDQKESFDSQREYYETLIKNNPKWHFSGVYADRGISGTTQHRPEFQRLVRTAKNGQIDLILVKSISRFARNAVDTQKVVHDLKSHNVEVYFEEQNLSSFNRNAEMALNMMAMVAESESRSISQNTQWALQKQAERGIRHLGNNRVFGYDEIDGNLVPNENAKYVKFMYESYASGMGISEIARAVTEQGARSLRGNKDFSASAVGKILANEIYCGDRNIQKRPHQDFLTKRPKWGEEYDNVYVENDHEAIVSRQLWNKVQKRLETRRDELDHGINRYQNSHFLAGKVICSCCRSQYQRIKVGNKDHYKTVWKCKDRIAGKKGSGCRNRIVDENEIFEALNAELGILGSDAADEKEYRKVKRIVVGEDGQIQIET